MVAPLVVDFCGCPVPPPTASKPEGRVCRAHLRSPRGAKPMAAAPEL